MAPEPLQRFSFALASGESASGEASAWARKLAEDAGWTEEQVYALDLCVVELVSNIVSHGYRGRPGEIGLELALSPARGELTIVDRAPAFDPMSVPAPVMATSIDEAQVGGFGVHLVRSTAARCRYERRGDENVFNACFEN